MLVLGDGAVGDVQQGGNGVDGDVGEELVPDELHDVGLDVHLKAAGPQGLGHLLGALVAALDGAHVGGAHAGVAGVAGAQVRGTVGGGAAADLLLGDHLGDLVVVADAVLQGENDGVGADHGLALLQGALQEEVLDEDDHDVHLADGAGVGGGDDGVIDTGGAVGLVDGDAGGVHGLAHGGHGIEDVDLVGLGEVAGVDAAHGAAAQESDFHVILPPAFFFHPVSPRSAGTDRSFPLGKRPPAGENPKTGPFPLCRGHYNKLFDNYQEVRPLNFFAPPPCPGAALRRDTESSRKIRGSVSIWSGSCLFGML